MKADGTPFKTVLESVLVIANVTRTHNKTAAVSRAAMPINSAAPLTLLKKKMERIAISVENFPLQGTNEFVRIASRRSLGESIILHPTTPAALHPKPMHMVNDCLPQALHF